MDWEPTDEQVAAAIKELDKAGNDARWYPHKTFTERLITRALIAAHKASNNGGDMNEETQFQIGDRVHVVDGMMWGPDGADGTIINVGPVPGFIDDSDLFEVKFDNGFRVHGGRDNMTLIHRPESTLTDDPNATAEDMKAKLASVAAPFIYNREQEQREHLRGAARDILSHAHINKAIDITITGPGVDRVITATFDVPLKDTVPTIAGIGISVRFGWATCDEAIKGLDAVLSTITSALDPSMKSTGSTGV